MRSHDEQGPCLLCRDKGYRYIQDPNGVYPTQTIRVNCECQGGQQEPDDDDEGGGR